MLSRWQAGPVEMIFLAGRTGSDKMFPSHVMQVEVDLMLYSKPSTIWVDITRSSG